MAEHAGRRTDHVLDLVTAHDRPYVGAGNGPTLTGHQHPCERAVLPQRGSRALRPVPVSARARALLAVHELRTLDALQLAAALVDGRRIDPGLVLVTRDERQARAARAERLAVR